jgi:hypothetical protein
VGGGAGGAEDDAMEHDAEGAPGQAAPRASTSDGGAEMRKVCYLCNVKSPNGRLTWCPECSKKGERGLMQWLDEAAQKLVFKKSSERRLGGGAMSLKSTVPEILFDEHGGFSDITYTHVDTAMDTTGMSAAARARWDVKQTLNYHLESDMMPALMYNPGKPENHTAILESILKTVGDRSWVFLGLDGSPFLQVYKLVMDDPRFSKFAVTCALGRAGVALHAVYTFPVIYQIAGFADMVTGPMHLCLVTAIHYIDFGFVFAVAALSAGHAWWSCRAASLQMTHAIFGYHIAPAHLGNNPSAAAQYLLEGDTDHHKGQDWLDIQQRVLERDMMLRFLESEVDGKPWKGRTVEDFWRGTKTTAVPAMSASSRWPGVSR